MGNLFPDGPEYPDYRPMPKVAVKFLGKTVEVVPAVLLVVTSFSPLWPVHEHQPERPHQEIVLIAAPVNALVEALPPSTGPMPFSNYDGSNDLLQMHWVAQRRAQSMLAANSTPTMSPAVLWFASTQAALSATT